MGVETVAVPTIGKRHGQIALIFMLLVVAIGVRVQFIVALVAMTTSSSSNPDVPVFDWDNQSIILSAFYWSYPILQIVAGNVGRLYGTKYFLMVAMILNSMSCFIMPWMANQWGSYGVMGGRVLQGFSQSFFYPSVNVVISEWSPVSERATLGNFALSGAFFGAIITTPLVGMISTTRYGWPLSFYLYGGLGLMWVIIFFFFGASTPQSHRSITKIEKDYIENNLDRDGPKVNIPWKAMILNGPFWAAFFCQVGQFWCSLILNLETPTYISKVMKFDIASNGFLSAAPALAAFILGLFFGYIADVIINKNILSIKMTRKLFTLIGSVIPAAALLTLGFSSASATNLSIAMLIISTGFSTAANSGACINHIDLSPSFAGVLLAIVNSSGAVVSIFGPIVVQLLVVDQSDKNQWTIIYVIAAAFFIFPSILYVFCGSADIQPYDPCYKNNTIEDTKKRLKKYSTISVLSL